MTITGGSALPKEDIDRMMREAEEYAEEDRKRREQAEVRNGAEQLVYQTEKFLADNGDKIAADVRSQVDEALEETKKTLEGADFDAIRAASEKLATVSQQMGASLYENQQATAGGTTGSGDPSGDDDVVDAEIVDEDGQK